MLLWHWSSIRITKVSLITYQKCLRWNLVPSLRRSIEWKCRSILIRLGLLLYIVVFHLDWSKALMIINILCCDQIRLVTTKNILLLLLCLMNSHLCQEIISTRRSCRSTLHRIVSSCHHSRRCLRYHRCSWIK